MWLGQCGCRALSTLPFLVHMSRTSCPVLHVQLQTLHSLHVGGVIQSYHHVKHKHTWGAGGGAAVAAGTTLGLHLVWGSVLVPLQPA